MLLQLLSFGLAVRVSKQSKGPSLLVHQRTHSPGVDLDVVNRSERVIETSSIKTLEEGLDLEMKKETTLLEALRPGAKLDWRGLMRSSSIRTKTSYKDLSDHL